MSGSRLRRVLALLALTAAVAAAVFPDLARPAVALACAAGLASAAFGAAGRAAAARAKGPSLLDSLERPRSTLERPPDLARLESSLGWKVYSAEEFDHFVAPRLSRILRARLSSRHGLDALADLEGARRVTPPDLWPLLTGTASADGESRTTADVVRVVDLIEAV